MAMLVVEPDTDLVDAGEIVRNVTAERGYVPSHRGQKIEGRRVFHNRLFTLIHQENPDGTETNEVYFKGDFVYRDERSGDAPPAVKIYRSGRWEHAILSEYDLADQLKLQF